MEEQHDVRESDDHDTGSWVLALLESGKGYLGRVAKLDGREAYAAVTASSVDGNGSAKLVGKSRSEVTVEELLTAETLTLNPVYDYREMVKEVPVVDPQTKKMMQDPNMPGLPAMQPMRSPLVMPVGFTLEQAPIHLRAKRYDIRALSQLNVKDAKTLREFAKATREEMKKMRMMASNLQAPTADDIQRINRSST